MMKREINVLLLLLIWIAAPLSAQKVLGVTNLTQEYDQWCWAGSSKSILDYYGQNHKQCDLVNYTRSVATFYDFGTADCCLSKTTPGWMCNYWNYNWGYAGSIADIFNNFVKVVRETSLGSSLTQQRVKQEIDGGNPFIIRWGWTSGGGHFIVGNGYTANVAQLHIMDPWINEGAQIMAYNTVVSAKGKGSWSHTQTFVGPALSSSVQVSSSIQVSSSSIGFSSSKPSSSSIGFSSSLTSSSSVLISSVEGVSSSEEGTSSSNTTALTPHQVAGIVRLQSADRFGVVLELSSGEKGRLQVVSATGQLIQELRVVGSGSAVHHSWSRTLPEGVHFVLLEAGTARTAVSTLRVER